MKVMRKIIEIDEEKCNGCGLCIPSCAEGALEIVDGKAKVVKDMFCDGLGACLGSCPQDALHIIEREAEEFDEEAAMEHVAHMKEQAQQEPVMACGCPGSNIQQFKAPAASSCPCMDDAPGDEPSQLSHWPVQIRLVPPHAPFLKGADLLVAADCAPVAMANFNRDYVKGRAVMIGCPKFDDAQSYVQKFVDIFRSAGLKSVTVVRMEVPCCTGLSGLVHKAAELSGVDVDIRDVVISTKGKVVDQNNPFAAM